MPYGYSTRTRVRNISSQKGALKALAGMAQRGMVDALVRKTALAIVRDCDARDDMCEIQAVFDAVKTGTNNVPALRNGVRYVSDPRDADYFTGPRALLELCEEGSCGEDCDSQSALVAALLGSLGFVVGLRAYAYSEGQDYEHVYAVVIDNRKNPSSSSARVLGLDTTVPSATPGWEPPNGKVLTAWIS